MTLEGQVLRPADIIAYVNHDFDDACRAGLMQAALMSCPKRSTTCSVSEAARLETLIKDVVSAEVERLS